MLAYPSRNASSAACVPLARCSYDEQFFNRYRYLRKLGGAPGMQNHILLLLVQGLCFYLFYNSEAITWRSATGHRKPPWSSSRR